MTHRHIIAAAFQGDAPVHTRDMKIAVHKIVNFGGQQETQLKVPPGFSASNVWQPILSQGLFRPNQASNRAAATQLRVARS